MKRAVNRGEQNPQGRRAERSEMFDSSNRNLAAYGQVMSECRQNGQQQQGRHPKQQEAPVGMFTSHQSLR